MGRAERGRRQSGDGSGRVDGRRRAVESNQRGSCGQSHRARGMHVHENALPRKAVGEKRGERHRERGRQDPQEPDDSHGENAAAVVGVDGQGHDMRPVPDIETSPGNLEPPKLRVLEDLAERAKRCSSAPERVREPRSQAAPAGDQPVGWRS